MLRAVITGVGGYVPDYVMTNEELSTMVDTNDEWIMTRTGIKERRILKEGSTSTMAIKAIEELLRKTNTKPEEVDLILLATVTPDMKVPATVNIIQEKLGLINAWGFDYQAGCSGFLFGIEIIQRFVESGRYKKAILVGSDMMSGIVNYKDRNTCILFGDGAGAIMVEPQNDSEFGIRDTQNYCDSVGAIECLNVKRHGSAYPLSVETMDLGEQFVYQDGMSWPYHISDLGGWDSHWAVKFGIESIPDNFLVDSTGKLVASRMNHDQLEATLMQLLK